MGRTCAGYGEAQLPAKTRLVMYRQHVKLFQVTMILRHTQQLAFPLNPYSMLGESEKEFKVHRWVAWGRTTSTCSNMVLPVLERCSAYTQPYLLISLSRSFAINATVCAMTSQSVNWTPSFQQSSP